jgi:hypothetical protein
VPVGAITKMKMGKTIDFDKAPTAGNVLLLARLSDVEESHLFDLIFNLKRKRKL